MVVFLSNLRHFFFSLIDLLSHPDHLFYILSGPCTYPCGYPLNRYSMGYPSGYPIEIPIGYLMEMMGYSKDIGMDM
jgi:hypothetical protein